MQQQFKVIKVENATMTLKINQSATCAGCSAKSGCGNGILSNYFNQSTLQKPWQKGIKTGDLVTLEIPSSELFLRAFQLYILPLIALFLGGLIGTILFPANELWQIALGLLSLLFSLLLLRYCTT